MDVIVLGAHPAAPEGKPIKHHGNSWLNFLVALGCQDRNPPLAALLAAYHGLSDVVGVLSPVHWEATHNDAMIVAAGEALQLTEDQAKLLFTAVRPFLLEEHMELFYHDKTTWLLLSQNKPSLRSESVFYLLHQSLMPVLARLDDSLYWQRLLTELQMLFSSLDYCATQEPMSINGVWVYGEGNLHFPQHKIVFSNDPNLLAAFPKNIRPLDNKMSLPRQAIIVYRPDEHFAHLINQVKNISAVNWYWDNIAYQTPKINPIKRIWSQIFYANKKKIVD